MNVTLSLLIYLLTPALSLASVNKTFYTKLLQKDKIGIQYGSYQGSIQYFSLNSGAPPVFLNSKKSSFLIFNVSYKESFFKFQNAKQNSFRRLSFTSLYRLKLNTKWTFLSLLPLSFSAEKSTSPFKSQAMNMVLVTSFKRKAFNPMSSLGLGLVAINRARNSLVVPNFSFSYLNQKKAYRIQFSFPKLEFEKLYRNFLFGALIGLDFETYLLKNKNSTTSDLSYLRSEKFLAGLKISGLLGRSITYTATIGKILNERLEKTDANLEPIASLNRSSFEGFFSNFKIGYRF